MVYSSWQQLPFDEIWAVDTEFYPGPGLANGGRDGDAPTPLCVVAIEMRSNRVIRQWQDELTPFPPYRLDNGALFIAYMNTAEFGTHLALGWGKPACTLDAYIEFRHYTNDGAVKAGDRDKGFYGLHGALRYFCEDDIDTAHKTDMRARIIQGPPFSADERKQILSYCEDDVRNLMRLIPHLVPTIRSLPHALARGDYTWLLALQERRGVPINLPKLEAIRAQWDPIRCDLVRTKDRAYGCYEIEDGKPHWRSRFFADYIKRHRMAWPTYPDGKLDEREQTFRDMAGRYPHVEALRDLRYTLSKLRLNDLAVGNDGRARCLLNPYGTKTARNAPSTTKFVFGPAKWLRFLIEPPPGYAIIHRDFSQQEVRISAHLSGDRALLAACEGDVYLNMADQLGFLRGGMSDIEIAHVRAMFKIVVLAIMYGLGPRTLAMQTGMSFYDACETLARLRARFHVYMAYADSVVDHANLDLEISTPFDWTMQCPPGIKANTVRNFPIQSTASEILHVACALAERRGVALIAPVHDALLAECPVDRAEEISIALDRAMRDAAAVVLRGHELPTDGKIIRPGECYVEKRGQEMWDAIQRLLIKLEERRA
jgi:hypothetical protein